MRAEQAAAMPNNQCLIGNLTEAKRSPTFEVRQLESARGWYVRVLWHYGQEHHVGLRVCGRGAELDRQKIDKMVAK